jgi:hypothetical protein
MEPFIPFIKSQCHLLNKNVIKRSLLFDNLSDSLEFTSPVSTQIKYPLNTETLHNIAVSGLSGLVANYFHGMVTGPQPRCQVLI